MRAKILSIALAAALVLVPSPAAPTSLWAIPIGGGVQATQMYLALGDSIAAGVGADDPRRTGYVPLLHERLRDDLACPPTAAPGCRPLHRLNLAQGGATTNDLVDGQLATALALLRDGDSHGHRTDIRVITVTIGGNDVFRPVVRACVEATVSSGCAAVVADRLEQVAANLNFILESLVTAAGQDAVVAVMTYADPLPACTLARHAALGNVVLEGGSLPGDATLAAGLNDIIRRAAERHGAVVADISGELAVQDFVGGNDCQHPDASGHRVMRDVFAEAVLAAAPD